MVMVASKYQVDPKVNMIFIAPDKRSTHYRGMDQKTAFKNRLSEAVTVSGHSSRASFAAAIGAGDNAKQVAQQWVDRCVIPEKYRRQMASLGVSIDYVNTGEGHVRHKPKLQSHDLRDAEEKMAKAGDLVASQFEQWGVEFRAREDVDLILGVYKALVSGSTVIDATKWLIREVEDRGLANERRGQA